MKHEVKKIQVTIAGKQYSLLSDESEEHVIYAALMVNNLIQESTTTANNTNDIKTAVLAALQLASLLKKLELTQETFKAKIEHCINAINCHLS